MWSAIISLVQLCMLTHSMHSCQQSPGPLSRAPLYYTCSSPGAQVDLRTVQPTHFRRELPGASLGSTKQQRCTPCTVTHHPPSSNASRQVPLPSSGLGNATVGKSGSGASCCGTTCGAGRPNWLNALLTGAAPRPCRGVYVTAAALLFSSWLLHLKLSSFVK